MLCNNRFSITISRSIGPQNCGSVGQLRFSLVSLHTAHLDDLLPVLGGVHGRLGQKDLAVMRVDVEFLRAEGVVPEVLHVVPVPDNTVLHGVVHLQHGAQLAGLIPHHQVLREVKSSEEPDTHFGRAWGSRFIMQDDHGLISVQTLYLLLWQTLIGARRQNKQTRRGFKYRQVY